LLSPWKAPENCRDEELREAMRERGLGTPATRSQIIEGLIHDGYIERKGKELIVSAKDCP